MKRYAPEIFTAGRKQWAAMSEAPDGPCARYEDVEPIVAELEAEVERLRVENERLRSDRDAQREAAIYGAAYFAATARLDCEAASGHAERMVDAWRAAQKGGSDG